MDATVISTSPNLTLAETAERLWDAVVIGAGPAGAMAAYALARAGASVLLVDKSHFPRRKVCGCCFNPAALRVLDSQGLGDIPHYLRAPQLHTFLWAVAGTLARIPLPGGAAVSREAFDTELLQRAQTAGATVLDGTAATLAGFSASAVTAEEEVMPTVGGMPTLPYAWACSRPPPNIDGENPDARRDSRTFPLRLVTLRRGAETATIQARIVIAADGLGGRSIDTAAGFERAVDRYSRIGAGTIAPAVAAPDYRAGVVHMACGQGGYVGLVRLEDGRLDVAGAFDTAFLKTSHGPGPAAVQILHSAGLPKVGDLADLPWHGTPWLTVSRPSVAGERLLIVGDAAGYVEPFTGEGLAWALASGAAVAPLALEAIDGWHTEIAQRWTDWYNTHIRPRQRWCRLVTRCWRHPRLTKVAARAVSLLPALARPLVTHLTSSVD